MTDRKVYVFVELDGELHHVGQLWARSIAIAKFPRKDDEFSTVLWEAVALSLASKAGFQVPEWRIESNTY